METFGASFSRAGHADLNLRLCLAFDLTDCRLGVCFFGTFDAPFCDLWDLWRRNRIIMVTFSFVFVFLITSYLHVTFRHLFLTFSDFATYF